MREPTGGSVVSSEPDPEKHASSGPAVPIGRRVTGERIYTELAHLAPSGARSRQELADRTGLTVSQVARGLTWIKEYGAVAHAAPFTYSRKDGYLLSDDPQVWISCVLAHMEVQLTGFKRDVSGIIAPFGARLPEDPRPTYFKAQISAMIETLKMMLSQETENASPRRNEREKGEVKSP